MNKRREVTSTSCGRGLRRALVGAWLLVVGGQALADPAALADPTAPAIRARSLVAPANPVAEYRLSGIWSRPGRTSAVINGATVVVGDAVAGARVIAINSDLVRLRLSDGTTTILRDAAQVVRRTEGANQPGELAARE